jgi:hypothetical protein
MEVWLLPTAVTVPPPAIATPAAVAPSDFVLARMQQGPGRKVRKRSSNSAPATQALSQSPPQFATPPVPASRSEPPKVAAGGEPMFDFAAARSAARAIAREDGKGMAERPQRQEAMGANMTDRV